jgi:hypothetical protein
MMLCQMVWAPCSLCNNQVYAPPMKEMIVDSARNLYWRFRPAGGRALANVGQLPSRGPVWLGKCFLARDLVQTPRFPGPKLEWLVEKPSTILNRGRRPLNFDPSKRLRALPGLLICRR